MLKIIHKQLDEEDRTWLDIEAVKHDVIFMVAPDVVAPSAVVAVTNVDGIRCVTLYVIEPDLPRADIGIGGLQDGVGSRVVAHLSTRRLKAGQKMKMKQK